MDNIPHHSHWDGVKNAFEKSVRMGVINTVESCMARHTAKARHSQTLENGPIFTNERPLLILNAWVSCETDRTVNAIVLPTVTLPKCRSPVR